MLLNGPVAPRTQQQLQTSVCKTNKRNYKTIMRGHQAKEQHSDILRPLLLVCNNVKAHVDLHIGKPLFWIKMSR